MWSPDRKVAILYNGEVYNFREERLRLATRGHRFISETDTEVVLALYLEQGLDFVESLRGMYAIAIFDWRKSAADQPPSLLLVRGPLGIKPLYIGHPDNDPTAVIFSSEIRAILASRLVAPNVDRQALSQYLSSGFVWQPRTIIKEITMMEPGTIKIYGASKECQTRQFWRVPDYQPRRESLDEAAGRLRSVLNESIRLHSFADVPVGAFLSGGVDSTAIVALMREHVSRLRTYTLRFPEFPEADESIDVADAAQTLQVENTIVDVVGSDVARVLPKFATDLDQPSNDGINTWLVSQAAARDVKGVLSGLGGDEWFAGYPVTRRMNRYSAMSLRWIQVVAAYMAKGLADVMPAGNLRCRMNNLAARRTSLTTWSQSHTVFPWSEVRHYLGLTGSMPTETAHYENVLASLNRNWRHESAVGLSLLLDTRVYMINQLLRDSDATSMAHSLELRVPLVDLKVTDFSRTCLDQHKLLPDGGRGDNYVASGSKRVLIHALRDLLPVAIATRPKRGFAVPTHRWMKSSLAKLVEETCRPEAVAERGLIDPRLVAPSWNAFHASNNPHAHRELWAVMIFELWCRSVLDQPTTKPDMEAQHALRSSQGGNHSH